MGSGRRSRSPRTCSTATRPRRLPVRSGCIRSCGFCTHGSPRSNVPGVTCRCERSPARNGSPRHWICWPARMSSTVEVAIVRHLSGSHDRLLAGVRGQFAQVMVDGRRWAATPRSRVPRLDPALPHDVVVRVATLRAGMSTAEVRARLERADGLGRAEILLGGTPVLRAPICPQLRRVGPTAGTGGLPWRDRHLLAPHRGRHAPASCWADRCARSSSSSSSSRSGRVPAGFRTSCYVGCGRWSTLGLGHLTLDRSMPTLSRGEAQRTRLAVVLSGRLEDLLHVLDEPTIGLHHSDLSRLLDAIATLPGPVLMVEHDPVAVAMADDVVEIGPGGGRDGGRAGVPGPARRPVARRHRLGLEASRRPTRQHRPRRLGIGGPDPYHRRRAAQLCATSTARSRSVR